MTLCDTGPLVALVNRRDRNHQLCADALDGLPREPLATTWSCWTEAHYLLGSVGGFRPQRILWSFLDDGLVELYEIGSSWQRVRELMSRYQDVPMDLADATIVVLAERLDRNLVFTLDSHFYAFRKNGTEAFELIT